MATDPAATTALSGTPSLPPIHDLPSLDVAARIHILDLLFEPCVPLHTLALPLLSPSGAQTFAPASALHHESFPSYKSLIDAVGAQMRALAESASTSDKTWLDGILSAHPRLGEKKVDSALSRMEQAAMLAASAAATAGSGAGADTGTGVPAPAAAAGSEAADEATRLKQLNDEYEQAFPGLRYVCVMALPLPTRLLTIFFIVLNFFLFFFVRCSTPRPPSTSPSALRLSEGCCATPFRVNQGEAQKWRGRCVWPRAAAKCSACVQCVCVSLTVAGVFLQSIRERTSQISHHG